MYNTSLEYDCTLALFQIDDGCPGLDYLGPICQPGHCDTTEISCMVYWSSKCYCHKVGVDLDTTANIATPAPMDRVFPARKLQEEKEPSNPYHNGCPSAYAHVPGFDSKCPSSQISCVRDFLKPQFLCVDPVA